MSGSDDVDFLMQTVRRQLTDIQEKKHGVGSFEASWNTLTPAVHQHYRNILEEIVARYFAKR